MSYKISWVITIINTTLKGIIMKETDNVEVADTYQLQRIANALEEILRLVKLDQEKMAKRFPDENQE